MLGACFPWPVGAAVRRDGDGGPLRLFPEEEAALSSRAVPRRREHFTLGRAAAHAALAALGAPVSPVRRGEKGEPLWPVGFTGAITHTEGVAAAVVGRDKQYAGIGVDIEPLEPGLTARAARLVCTDAENAWVHESETDEASGTRATVRRTMLFSAKEAIFKALFPVERVWLGFLDAELRWRPEAGELEATLLRAAGARYPAGYRLRVACRTTDRFVLTATYVAGG